MLPPFMRKQHLQKLFLGWGQLIPGACAGCFTVMTRLQKVGPKIDLCTVSPMCRFYSLQNGQAEMCFSFAGAGMQVLLPLDGIRFPTVFPVVMVIDF